MEARQATLTLLSATLLLTALAPSSLAQSSRTWVSGVGDDANPCSRTAPCKSFQGALSKTAAGGEIDAIDAGGFGQVTINKSMTIDGTGVMASVLTGAGNGIIINAGASDVVTLRNLSINGLGAATNGIRILSAGAVQIENVRIFGFTNNGIDMAVTSSATKVAINGVIITGCGNAGVSVDSTNALTTVAADGLNVHNSGTGLSATAGSRVVSRNSDFSENTTGVAATGANTFVTLDSAMAAHCTTALSASSNGTVRMSNVSVVDNTTGLSASGGSIISFVNNRISGNTTNGAPTQSVYQR